MNLISVNSGKSAHIMLGNNAAVLLVRTSIQREVGLQGNCIAFSKIAIKNYSIMIQNSKSQKNWAETTKLKELVKRDLRMQTIHCK